MYARQQCPHSSRMRFVYITMKTLFAATALTSTDVCLDKIGSNYRVQISTDRSIYSIAKSNQKYTSNSKLKLMWNKIQCRHTEFKNIFVYKLQTRVAQKKKINSSRYSIEMLDEPNNRNYCWPIKRNTRICGLNQRCRNSFQNDRFGFFNLTSTCWVISFEGTEYDGEHFRKRFSFLHSS